jgi:hypothetical protein
MSIDRCKSETSVSQYKKWMVFLDWKESESFDRNLYYLAQIATEVRRSYSKNPQQIKLKDFIIKFMLQKQDNNSLLSKEERTMRAKQFAFALSGLSKINKRKKK